MRVLIKISVLLLIFVVAGWSRLFVPAPGATVGFMPDVCLFTSDPEPPPYYQIDLVSTRKVPGAGQAKGVGTVAYKSTPFGVAVGPDGSYVYNLDVKVHKLAPAKKGQYVAWVSTPDISQIKRLGPLDEAHQIHAVVDWNKFLVIITLEQDLLPDQPKWKGPVVLRGLSRSGLMHTMAGHGPYQNEPCAVYGY